MLCAVRRSRADREKHSARYEQRAGARLRFKGCSRKWLHALKANKQADISQYTYLTTYDNKGNDMSKTDENISNLMERRDFLRSTGAITAALATEYFLPSRALAAEDIQLAAVVQSSTNAAMLSIARGAQIFADSIGLPFKMIDSNGDSQQQLSQIQATIASGKRLVFTIVAINPADVPSIVRAVGSSGGALTTHFNKPKGYHPWDAPDGYVAHLAYDGAPGGKWTATQLFKAMGGKGGIIAFKGQLDAIVSQQRYEGLQQALAEFPNIKLLDTQVANWERQQAFDISKTMMTKYGAELGGIWSASDSMATGAYAAVEQAGRLNDVKFVGIDGNPEAVKLIDEGSSFIATYTTDTAYNGAIGLAIAYAGATGALDLKSLTHEQREGNYRQVSISKENVKAYLKPISAEALMAEVNKGLFDRLLGPARD